MFRLASIGEVRALLRSFDQPAVVVSGTAEEQLKQYCDVLTRLIVESASKFVVGGLTDKKTRDDITAISGLTFDSCDCLEKGTTCPSCLQLCVNVAEGMLTVLERDFVQLTNGEYSHMFDSHQGAKFLLTGIVLGLLYQSVPESQGLNQLTKSALCAMMNVRRWVKALEFFCPAPIVSNLLSRQRSNTNNTGKGRRSPKVKKQPRPARTASGSPACADCKKELERTGILTQCVCGAVVIDYEQQSRLAGELHSLTLDAFESRDRSMTM